MRGEREGEGEGGPCTRCMRYFICLYCRCMYRSVVWLLSLSAGYAEPWKSCRASFCQFVCLSDRTKSCRMATHSHQHTHTHTSFLHETVSPDERDLKKNRAETDCHLVIITLDIDSLILSHSGIKPQHAHEGVLLTRGGTAASLLSPPPKNGALYGWYQDIFAQHDTRKTRIKKKKEIDRR